jgi:colanic acid/amylovoran biosynthesis protein
MHIVKAPFYRSHMKIILTALRSVIWLFFNRIFKMDLHFLIKGEEYQAIHACDVVIDLGGDTVAEEYGIRNLLLHFLPLFIAVVFKKPVVAYSQTMGPFGRWKYLARFLFKVFDLIILRDKASIETLKAVNYRGAFQCTADTAFCLENAAQDRLDKIAGEEHVDLSAPYIAISISPMMNSFYERRNRELSPLPYYRMMALLIDRIVVLTNCHVILVAHVTGGKLKHDDRFSAKAVAANCEYGDRVHCIQGEYSPSEIKAIIGNAEAMIGARMHCNIAALSNLVPTMAISYSLKSHGIMEVCGQSEWVYPVERLNGDTLFNQFKLLWEKRAGIRSELSTRIPEVKSLAASNGKIFAEWYEFYIKAKNH